MDDIVAELSSFIESKEGMDTIKNLASSLMSGDGDVSSMLSSLMSNGAESVISSPKKEEPADFPSFAPDQLASIMSVMSALNKSGDDARTRLLLALKPHLSEKRRERVDRAIKLMKLISIMPLITESGLFKL